MEIVHIVLLCLFIMGIFWPDTAFSSLPHTLSESASVLLPSNSVLFSFSFMGPAGALLLVLLPYFIRRLFHSSPSELKDGTTKLPDKTIKPKSKTGNFKAKTKAINILYDGGASTCTDIVAVHGLASNPETTWNYRDGEGDPPLWLRDFLPQEEGLNARIVAFNYNSEWKSSSLNKSLEDHGTDLLLALYDIRQKPEEKNRGIIFIGHSFGGIVIKQAIFNAHNTNPKSFQQDIINSAKGFVFLGTPHRGSSITSFGKLLSLLNFWRGSSTSLLRAIEPGSTSNRQIHETFIHRYSMKDMVVCIFEAVQIRIWGFPVADVVTKDSAKIDHAEFFGFEASHQNLQRFGSREDSDYRNLVNCIRRLIKAKTLVSSTTQPYVQSPTTLAPPNIALDRSESVKFPVDTLNLGQTKNFVGRDSEMSIMHSYMPKDQAPPEITKCLVYGAGGHGKTQFVLEYAYKYKKWYNAIFWVEAESDIVLLRSFGAIGRALKLFNDETIGQVEKERILAWLKTTPKRWLLVFDNVTEQVDIKSYCPPSSEAGLIIATSQIFSEWADYNIRLKPLDDDNGSRLVLSQLHRSNLALDSPERKQAEEISSLLGGSPLWLKLASALITSMSWSLSEFLENLKTSSNTLEEEDIATDWNYGKPALATFDRVLDTLFKFPKSKDLLFMIAFMNPERIEETMLLAKFKSSNLSFIGSKNKTEFHRMIGPLNKRNLVSREKAKKSVNSDDGVVEELAFLTTHRSLQEGLLFKMNKMPDTRKIAFDRVVDLLIEQCPLPLKTLQPVEAHWPIIQALLPHLLALVRGFERSQPPIPGYFRFAKLLTDMGGMTLFDHGFTSQVQMLLKKAKKVLDDIGDSKDAAIRGDIGTVLALNTDNLGISKRAKGLELRRKTLTIRQKCHDKLTLLAQGPDVDDEILLFNADTDLACSLQQYNRFDEVAKICERCLTQYQIWGDEDKFPYEYAKYYNHSAYVLMYEGETTRAVKFAKRGSDLMASGQPGSQMAVTFEFDWATILFQAGETVRAIEEHLELLKDRISGCGLLNIMTLQSRIHIGVMYFLVKDYRKAGNWLRPSLQLAKEIDAPAENLARIKYYLAQAMLDEDQQNQDAARMDQEAKDLLHNLLKIDGSDSMNEFVAAENYPMLFDYIVTWESRLTTPRRRVLGTKEAIRGTD